MSPWGATPTANNNWSAWDDSHLQNAQARFAQFETPAYSSPNRSVAPLSSGSGGFNTTYTAAGASTGNPYAAAAGAVLDLYQGLSAGKQSSTQRKRARDTVWRHIKPTQQRWWDKAQVEAEKVPRTIQEGFASAKREAGEAFRGAAIQASDITRGAEADARASLAGSGMLASSIYTNVRLGMGAQTARVFTGIMDRLAQLQTSLTTQGTLATANAQQGLASFYQAREVAENAPNLLLYQLRANK